MFKVVYCVARRADLTREEFLRTWLNDHAPIATKHADALRAVRYVQSHTGMEDLGAPFRATRDMAGPFDGITEMWFESREEFEEAASAPEGRAAAEELLEDEKRFVDFSKSTVFFTEEHEIF